MEYSVVWFMIGGFLTLIVWGAIETLLERRKQVNLITAVPSVSNAGVADNKSSVGK